MKQEYKKYYEQFGLNVVYYRKRKRLTQMKLADVDRSHISAIELGNVGVSFDVIFKLCEVVRFLRSAHIFLEKHKHSCYNPGQGICEILRENGGEGQ